MSFVSFLLWLMKIVSFLFVYYVIYTLLCRVNNLNLIIMHQVVLLDKDGLEKYFEDLQHYEDELYCSHCNNHSKKTFTYSRTVANGEVFFCHRCKEENLVGNKPNEDDY